MCCHSIIHLFANGATLVYMSMPVLKIRQLWPTPGSDFIKTNHQNHIKTLRMLRNIFIKLLTVCGVLPFNITLVFRLFTKGKTFVYMSPCSLKFDNSRIYFSGIDKNYVITGGKRMTWGNCLMLRKQSTCDMLQQWIDSKYSTQNVNKSLNLSQCSHC